MKQSELERSFETYWRSFAPSSLRDVLVPQYRFHDVRKFRIDFAIPDQKIGIELNGAGGGGWGRTIRCHACGALVRARNKNGSLGKALRVAYPSHAKGDMTLKDAEKVNLLTSMGWRIFIITPHLLSDNPQAVIGQIVEVAEKELYK